MGINYKIVDSAPRIANAWRTRYDSIKLHTPTYTDHYPYMKFPDDMPKWLTGNKVADWAEHYSKTMDLNVLLESKVTSVEYDESTRRYTVSTEGPGGKKTFTPHHVVMAAGMFSNVPIRPHFPGEDAFKGQVYHTVEHKSASLIPDLPNKKVVVVGCSTSAHDVCQDFVDCGAKDITMIQRHPIFSVTTQSCEAVVMSIFNTPGMALEEADLVSNSFPFPILRSMSIGQTQMMAQMDQSMLEGLEKAGMALRKGEDGVGMIEHQFIKGGHFYIDQGAMQMIVDGKIKIKRCEGGVTSFSSKGLLLADGTELAADVVVLATGFERNLLTVEQIMGNDVRQKVGDLGYLDHEQERLGVSSVPSPTHRLLTNAFSGGDPPGSRVFGI